MALTGKINQPLFWSWGESIFAQIEDFQVFQVGDGPWKGSELIISQKQGAHLGQLANRLWNSFYLVVRQIPELNIGTRDTGWSAGQ
jgi:hypothetical protein